MPVSFRRMLKEQMQKHIIEKIRNSERAPYQRGTYPFGLNLIGPLESATGLGQSFRLLIRMIEKADIPYIICNCDWDVANKVDISEYQGKIEDKLKYSVNLWHVSPSKFDKLYRLVGEEAFDGRYNIAYWLWELERFPEEWVPYIDLLDEIWTPSEFISKGIREKTDKPVQTIPYYVTAESDIVKYDRDFFRLPKDKFLFLIMYDAQSVRERKNPEGAIRAFQLAFSSECSDVGLIIKVNAANEREMRILKKALKDYKNVYFITMNMEKLQVNSLIACADVYVSLHRAEGFGLVLAEAMLNRTPVIATDWSANTEFMNSKVACMVSYTMSILKKNLPLYKKGDCWAEPDLDEAAKYMKRLYKDREYYNEIADQAYTYIGEKLGIDKIKNLIQETLGKIANEE